MLLELVGELLAQSSTPSVDPVPVDAPEPIPVEEVDDRSAWDVVLGALQSAAGLVTALTVVGGALWVLVRPHFRRMVAASKVQAEAVSDSGPIAVRLDELREHSNDNRRLLDQVIRTVQDTANRLDTVTARLDKHVEQHLANDKHRDGALIATLVDRLTNHREGQDR